MSARLPRQLPGCLLCAALCVLTASACAGTRKLVDPTLRIHTEGGWELGVSTRYGVVFLGRTATAGYVEIEAHFGDGPSIESTVIEPLGGGLYTAETEIYLPAVPLKFHNPRPGDELLVAGRTPEGRWEQAVRVRSDPRVHGLLLDVPPRVRRADQVGAGVYWVNPRDRHDRRLMGLVTGLLQIDTDGSTVEYMAVAGPEDLWRLVTHRRDLPERKRWIYREDIL